MFVSSALNLVPGITVTGDGVYLRNMSTGATTLVSVNNTGTDTGDGVLLLDGVAISPNGRYVTWAADSNNVVTGVSNSGNGWQEFLRDLQTGTTIELPGSGNLVITGASFSPDSSSLLFSSTAANLVPGIANPGGAEQLYLRNLATGTTQMVSVNPAGNSAGNDGSIGGGQFSGNGQFVLFESAATNLIPGGGGGSVSGGGTSGLFVRNLTTGTTQLVATDAGESPSISGDGSVGSLHHRTDQRRSELVPPQHANRDRHRRDSKPRRHAARQRLHEFLAVERQWPVRCI